MRLRVSEAFLDGVNYMDFPSKSKGFFVLLVS